MARKTDPRAQHARALSRLLPRLEPAERRELDVLLEMPTSVWEPLPGPQTLAFDSVADVIGYGGAAGGGKTDLALGKALRQHARVAVFRRNGTEHTAFVDRMEEVLGSREGYNAQSGIWRLRLADGRRVQVELGSVPNAGDERKYRGRPHDLKVFDEAAEIPEAQVRFLMGWMRTTRAGQRCQALLCFNPPTTNHGRWIVKFFAPWLDRRHPRPAAPGELRWFAMLDGVETEVESGAEIVHGGERIRPQSRTFIPARVADNPYLLGSAYMSTLQALPEPLRSQMLHGDFNAGSGEDPWQVIPTAWVEAAMARWHKPARLPPMDALGVDVARGGADQTVIARRHGLWFDAPLAHAGRDTPDGPAVAGLVIAAARDGATAHIDVIGVGASPYDFLRKARQSVVGVNVAEKSHAADRSGRLRFFNLRSELWWKMREALDPAHNTGIMLPRDPRLLADLTAPRWEMRGAAVFVESRDDLLNPRRLGRSPDFASAYLLALIETARRGQVAERPRSADYDPRELMERR